MASVSAATAAAAAGLAAVAAWFATPGTVHAGRFAVGPVASPAAAGTLAWQSAATGIDRLPETVLAATTPAEVAVIDTGADVSASPLAAHPLETYNVLTRSTGVADTLGHGTFVASLAAVGNGPLLIVKAAGSDGSISTVAEAAAIRYAVDHGARVINLSFAGLGTSPAERAAIRYAAGRGTLLVAAAGNDGAAGDPVEYPAALLQPVGSKGHGGYGLVVGASTQDGQRAAFSNSGSWISIAAPGQGVLGALAGRPGAAPRNPIGIGSGTSYAAPQVAAAAALVWGVDPSLTARQVADLLKSTASGHGTWSAELGYGVLDVPAAVASAQALRQ